MIALPLFAAFLAPPLYSVTIAGLAGIFFLHFGFAKQEPAPKGTSLVLAIWFAFATLAVLGPTFVSAYSDQNIDSLKFFVAGFAFFLGAALGQNNRELRMALVAFLVTISFSYFFNPPVIDSYVQDRDIYPPDQNHSAAMLAIALPIVLLRFSGWQRLAMFGLMMTFAFLVSSRALLALSVVGLAASPDFIRHRKWIMALAIPLALAILLFQGFTLNNFSDQLRLQILQVSLSFALTQGLYAFNLGETYFTNFLNIYPIYRRLEIQHAHNIILQVWVAYGVTPLIVFLTWIAILVRYAWRGRSAMFALQLGALAMFGMIEAMITDIRSFGTVMLFLGAGFAQAANAINARRKPFNNEPAVSATALK